MDQGLLARDVIVRPLVTEKTLRQAERHNAYTFQVPVSAGKVEIAATRETIAELRTELYGGSSRLPPEKMESYIVDRLDRISASHEVELVGVTPGEAQEVLMFDEVPYDVRVEGDYFALFRWLREVERELRPMVVKEFNIRPLADTEAVAMKLRLASYRQKGESS